MTTQPVFSSPSSSSFTHDSWTYDVFLSFRGEDIHTNFTDNLYKALSDKGICTFIDRELTTEEEISPGLLKAIEDSRISVIVFSENYASSRWCLDELVEILRCKESKQQIVLPIFYKVDPSHVRNQTSKFGDAFKGLIQSKFKNNEEKVLIWRKALTKAANLSEHPFREGEYEATIINNIVNGILIQVPRRTPVPDEIHENLLSKSPPVPVPQLPQLSPSQASNGTGGGYVNFNENAIYAYNSKRVGFWNCGNTIYATKPKKVQSYSRTSWNVAKYPVGIESHVQDMEMLLNVGGNGRRIVGIWGTSGIGKTTIAKAIWNAMAHKFEGSCFLENVREKSMPHGGLIQLQEALLHKILGKKLKIYSVAEGIGVIKERLRHKKILLILDDVNELEQLDNLAGVGWFGEGSRVITTTQDRGLLKCHGIDLIYEVQKLYGDRALQLFSLNALGKNEPPNDYLELAQRAIAYAHGLPLALTLLGSHLRNKDKDRWQDILDSYEGEPYTGIQKILQKSYDALENSVQQVFLDIACFFNGEDKDYVLEIVSNSKNKVSRDCIEVLIEKAMITTDLGTIRMHDLLEKLGKDVVREESPNDPGERSRLWSPEDVHRVLTEKNIGTRKIKGIMLKFPKPNEIHLHSKCFVGMVNLEIFINRNIYLSGDVKYLPNELRVIEWGRWQLKSLPSEFHPVYLREFNMPGGSIRRLEKLKNMPKLTSMNLSDCKFLEKIPDLSGIPNIKYLDLRRCTSLIEVDGSVGLLGKLVQLNLHGCVRLTRFATRLRLNSLEELYLGNCERLESFPEIDVEMESLGHLDIAGSGIRELPSSIAYLTGLEELIASNCENLTFGDTGIRLKNMPKLTSMNLNDCKFLEKIPDLSGIPNIKYLDIRRCTSLVEVDDSVGLLDKLVQLNLHGCVRLTRFATRLRLNSLEGLYLGNCERLESFPEIEVEMESLRELDIAGSGIRELPSSIAYLTGLKALFARNCENLTFGDTVNSQVSSSNTELLPNLFEVSLKGCNLSKIDFLLALDCWSTLVELDLSENNFVILPKCISKFVNLRELKLNDCMSLQEIPEQVLPPRVVWVKLDNCTSLHKIPKVTWVKLDNCTWPQGDDDGCGRNTWLSLIDCVRLRGNDITQEIFLSQVSVSSPLSGFEIYLPGDKVPEWFSCCKDATQIRGFYFQPVKNVRDFFNAAGEICNGRCEVSFEIPPNLKWETLRLVLCVFSSADAKILVNGKLVNQISFFHKYDGQLRTLPRKNHVLLKCIPLINLGEDPLTSWLKQGNMCQVIFNLYGEVTEMHCGVHLLDYEVSETVRQRSVLRRQ